jgi:hypothetical protein
MKEIRVSVPKAWAPATSGDATLCGFAGGEGVGAAGSLGTTDALVVKEVRHAIMIWYYRMKVPFVMHCGHAIYAPPCLLWKQIHNKYLENVDKLLLTYGK